MSHFAKINNGIVEQVITAEQDFINILPDAMYWVQTSYNTHGGVNLRQGGTPLHKNYAGIGYAYDSVRDAFIPPRPYQSWLLDEATCLWVAPFPKPNDGKIYQWDENSLSWVTITI